MTEPQTRGYALITGASRGIGAAFAQALADQGRNLVLSARSGPELLALRQRLLRPGADIRCIAADLADGGAARILDQLADQKLEVELLVNNAGLGSGGDFASLPLERELEQLRVNIAALVELTHGCLPAMMARKRGQVIHLASTASFQGVPYMATYAATKAFVLHFSLALYVEARARGVHVMALCPGPTRTEFFKVAGIRPRTGGMQTPEQVVELGLRGLSKRRPVVVCGTGNRILVAAERLLPRALVSRAAGRVIRAAHTPL